MVAKNTDNVSFSSIKNAYCRLIGITLVTVIDKEIFRITIFGYFCAFFKSYYFHRPFIYKCLIKYFLIVQLKSFQLVKVSLFRNFAVLNNLPLKKTTCITPFCYWNFLMRHLINFLYSNNDLQCIFRIYTI